MKDIFTILFSLIGVVFLIMLTYYGAKWLNKRVHLSTNGAVKVLERVNLGPEKAIMIIAIGEKCMLLGVTQEHIDKISDLDKADVDKLLEEKKATEKPSLPQSFAASLAKVIMDKKHSKGGDDIDKG